MTLLDPPLSFFITVVVPRCNDDFLSLYIWMMQWLAAVLREREDKCESTAL